MDYLCCIASQNQVFIYLLFLMVLVYERCYFSSFIVFLSLVILELTKLLLYNNVFGGHALPLMFACLFMAVLCVNRLNIPLKHPLVL